MLERTAYGMLVSWMREGQGQALLVDGARQIGKTYLIEEFARREYPSYIKVDFIEDSQLASTLAAATSARQALEALTLASGKTAVPGQTLVFLDEVQEAQNLVTLYRDDVAKHAGDRSPQVRAIYDSLPAQLDKGNKRFVLKQIKADAKFERYANDFAWLTGACAALKTTCVRDPRPMLERSEERNRFKLYLSDVGMLMSQYHTDVALAGERSVNFGGVYENVVAQELAMWKAPLHYYHHTRLGEVDFMGESSGAILPVEVKSGKNYRRHVALNNLLRSEEYGIPRAYVLCEGNVSEENREGKPVRYLPLYMLPLVAEELSKGSLDGVVAQPPTW